MSTKEQTAPTKAALPAFAQPWMILSILTVFLWGAWGLESKFVVDRISPWLNTVVFSFGLIPPAIWMLLSKNLRKVSGNARRGAFHGLVTGFLGGVGNIGFYLALAKGGQASIVVPLVGLAPLVTIVLALLILKESINRVQAVGLVLAVISIFLLSL